MVEVIVAPLYLTSWVVVADRPHTLEREADATAEERSFHRAALDGKDAVHHWDASDGVEEADLSSAGGRWHDSACSHCSPGLEAADRHGDLDRNPSAAEALDHVMTGVRWERVVGCADDRETVHYSWAERRRE